MSLLPTQKVGLSTAAAIGGGGWHQASISEGGGGLRPPNLWGERGFRAGGLIEERVRVHKKLHGCFWKLKGTF